MTTENEHTNLFASKCIASHEENGVSYKIYENRIYHVVIPSFNNVGMEIVEIGYAFLKKNGGGKFFNVFQFDSFSDIKPEMREWSADSDGNKNTFTDAIVIESLSQKIIADFYLKFNKPTLPTKIFYSLEKAADWTLKQVEKEKGQ